MDSFAVGLKVAQRLLDDQVFENILTERYKSFKEGIGKDIIEGKTDFHKLEEHVLDLTDIDNQSGRLEEIKATINQYLDRKSTRLNSSHVSSSYAVFCLKRYI